jgi:general secretion pathway protein G
MNQRTRRGFTLIEILVVIAILATLASAIVVTLHKKPDEARVAKTKSDIATLEGVLETCRLDMRRYPTEEEGLMALVKAPDSEDADRWGGPYIKRLQRDPWDRDYVYVAPGTYNPESFDLFSYGADGMEGGDGFNADIGNWEAEEMMAEE